MNNSYFFENLLRDIGVRYEEKYGVISFYGANRCYACWMIKKDDGRLIFIEEEKISEDIKESIRNFVECVKILVK